MVSETIFAYENEKATGSYLTGAHRLSLAGR